MRTVAVVGVVGALALSVAGGAQVEVKTGVFLFSPGQKIALELTGDDPCPCACGTIYVQGFSVRNSSGGVVYVDTALPYPVAAGAWTGRWDLAVDGTPVEAGDYTLLVETSLGLFAAGIRVVLPGGAPAGWGEAEATVCGIGLRVYRLVEEDNAGSSVSLRVGEHLMVALPGNPTTGFEWEPVEKPAALTRLPGVDYRPRPGPIVFGGGGTFYFRYRATAPGAGDLSFAYRRPWEAAPPGRTFSILVTVR